MKRFIFYWRLITSRPIIYFLSMIISIVFQLTFIFSGIVVKEIFNSLNNNSSSSLNVWVLVIFYLAIPLVNNAAMQINNYIISTIDLTIKKILRSKLYNTILKMPGAHALKTSINESLTRFRDDIDDITKLAVMPIRTISTIIFSFFAIIIMMRINFFLTLVAVFPMFIVIVMMRILQERIRKVRKLSRESTGDITHFIGEIINSVHSIKLFSCENNFIKHLEKLCDKRRSQTVMDAALNGFFDAVFLNLVYFALGIILILAGNMFKQGELTVGDLAIFEYYFWFIRMLPSVIGNFLRQYRHSAVSFDRIDFLLEGLSYTDAVFGKRSVEINSQAPVVQDQGECNDFIIRFKKLNYSYNTTTRGIKDIDLVIKSQSITVISGKIATGKTTLLRCMIGLIKLDSGKIMIDNVSGTGNVGWSILRPPFCSYTPQIPRLFSDSIKNNILMGRNEKRVDLEKLIYLTALDKDLKEFENGIDTLIGCKGSRLSGGQQKRVALARMLAINPSIIVIDDFSSALDIETEQLIFERLIKPRIYTSILVSNRATLVQNADNNLVIDDGAAFIYDSRAIKNKISCNGSIDFN